MKESLWRLLRISSCKPGLSWEGVEINHDYPDDDKDHDDKDDADVTKMTKVMMTMMMMMMILMAIIKKE